MTPERLVECLDALRWWVTEMADAMGANPRTVARWVSGKNPIPDEVGAWIERLAEYEQAMLATHPPPDKPGYIPRDTPGRLSAPPRGKSGKGGGGYDRRER